MSEDNIPLIFLGAFLAFLATAIVEVLKSYYQLTLARKNFTIFLKLELNSIKEVLARIKAKHEASSFYDYLLIDVLDNEVVRIDGARIEALVLKSKDLQEKFFNLTTDLSMFSKDIRSIQNFFYDEQRRLLNPEPNNPPALGTIEELEKIDQRRRNEKATELVEINRKIDELLKEL